MPDESLKDWANLPAGVHPISLADSVQDAQLRAIRSDLRARTVAIQFVPLDLIWTDGLAFTFTLEGVESVRALRYSGRREESQSWKAFELAVASDEQAELRDGDLVRGAGGSTALRLEIQMGDGESYDIFVRAQGVRIRRSDGQAFSLDQFLELGIAYMEAFEKRIEDTV